MIKKLVLILPIIACVLPSGAHANWEYDGEYVNDGWYRDDGSRFVVSVRGGVSLAMAKIKNDMGNLTANYYTDGSGNIFPEYYCGVDYNDCIISGYTYVGYAQLGDLPPKKNYADVSFAGGASVGWILPYHNNWRLELGWDKVSETDYNVSPLFDGNLALSGGGTVTVKSGSAQSTLSTDVISFVMFYDFFDGNRNTINKFIPYVGFGFGYAQTKTELSLTDSYGDLSVMYDLGQYGTPDENGILKFNKSEKTTSTVAGVLALGASYGITETIFFDFGARLMYIPRASWVLSNTDGSITREWFHAENMLYANLMVGLRFEF